MSFVSVPAGNPLEDVHLRTSTTGPQSPACVVGVDGSDSVVRSDVTRGLRVDYAGSSVVTGRATYTTPGPGTYVPVRLNGGVSLPCKSVHLTAPSANVAQIAVGDSNVDIANLRGVQLDPGQSVIYPVDDVSNVWWDVVDTSTITWTVVA